MRDDDKWNDDPSNQQRGRHVHRHGHVRTANWAVDLLNHSNELYGNLGAAGSIRTPLLLTGAPRQIMVIEASLKIKIVIDSLRCPLERRS